MPLSPELLSQPESVTEIWSAADSPERDRFRYPFGALELSGIGVRWHRRGAIANSNTPVKSGRVTVPGHAGDDVAMPTLNSILKQAQLEETKS